MKTTSMNDIHKVRRPGPNELSDAWIQRVELKDASGSLVDSAEGLCEVNDGSCDFEDDTVRDFAEKHGLANPDEIIDCLMDDKVWTDGRFSVSSERWLIDKDFDEIDDSLYYRHVHVED